MSDKTLPKRLREAAMVRDLLRRQREMLERGK